MLKIIQKEDCSMCDDFDREIIDNDGTHFGGYDQEDGTTDWHVEIGGGYSYDSSTPTPPDDDY